MKTGDGEGEEDWNEVVAEEAAAAEGDSDTLVCRLCQKGIRFVGTAQMHVRRMKMMTTMMMVMVVVRMQTEAGIAALCEKLSTVCDYFGSLNSQCEAYMGRCTSLLSEASDQDPHALCQVNPPPHSSLSKGLLASESGPVLSPRGENGLFKRKLHRLRNFSIHDTMK